MRRLLTGFFLWGCLFFILFKPQPALAEEIQAPTSVAESADFQVTFTGLKTGRTGIDCYIIRIQDAEGNYINRETGGALAPSCDTSDSNYYYSFVPQRSENTIIIEGQPAGTYTIELNDKGLFNRLDILAQETVTITPGNTPTPIPPTPTPRPRYSCDFRPPGCSEEEFPTCVRSVQECPVEVACSMQQGAGIDCAYRTGVTPSVNPICSQDPQTGQISGCPPLTTPTMEQTSTGPVCTCRGAGEPTSPPADTPPPPHPPCSDPTNDDTSEEALFTGCDEIYTGLGFGIKTNPTEFISSIFAFLLSISGSIMLLLIIFSGYQMMTSQGNAERIQEARERITSAIVGFLFLIFSLVILEVIGVDILRIPGFVRTTNPPVSEIGPRPE